MACFFSLFLSNTTYNYTSHVYHKSCDSMLDMSLSFTFVQLLYLKKGTGIFLVMAKSIPPKSASKEAISDTQ